MQLSLYDEMSKQTVTIKMKPYLRDYLVHLYGDPVRFNDRSKYNELLLELLSKPPKDYIPGRECGDTVNVELPYNSKKNIRTYYYLSNNSQDIIQQRIYCMFYAELFYFVNKCTANKNINYARLSIQQAVVLFLEKHGVSPDSVTVDTIRKQYYRYRASINDVDVKKILSL